MAKKSYILDTNVLMFDAKSIFHFEDNDVIIPISVIKELDKFKKDQTEEGRNARTVIRTLDELRATGSLATGVKTENGGTIRVVCRADQVDNADSQILELGRTLTKESRDIPCVVVTKDINLRVQCDVMGVKAEDYETGRVDIFNEIYSGHAQIEVNGDLILEFRRKHEIEVPSGDFIPNQYLLLTNSTDPKDKAMGRVDSAGKMIIPLVRQPRELNVVQPKNKEQHFFMDALLDPNIQLVTVVGRAGSGKTLLSVAAGFYQTVEENKYMKLLVSRPVYPMGKDIGYLPGEIADKMAPWMRPFYDAFDFLADSQLDNQKKGGKQRGERAEQQSPKGNDNGIKMMEKSGRVEVEPLMYIRGRSIHRQFVIVDEAQNLTSAEIKTIITRAGLGTKIVITADIYQIDNPYLDSMSNGFSYVVGKMRGQGIYAHICLEKGVRSELATLGSLLL